MDKKQKGQLSSFSKTWDILSPFLYYYIVYNIVFILLAFLINSIMGHMGAERAGRWMEQAETMNGILGGLSMLAGILPLLPMLKKQLQEKKNENREHSEMGLYPYLVTIVLAFTSSVGLNIILILTGMVEQSETYSQVAKQQYGVSFGIGLILYGIISPFAEEVVFRGMIYNRTKKYFPTVLSVIISAVLFGAYHGNLVQGIYGTCMGILLAYGYERFEDFKIPCLFHGIANLSVFSITYHSQLYGMMIGWGNCVILIVIFMITIFYIEKMDKMKKNSA